MFTIWPRSQLSIFKHIGVGGTGGLVFIPAYRKCFCRAYKRKTANENLSQDNVEFHQSFKGVGVEEEIVFIPVKCYCRTHNRK